jgi:glycosyltransferase involved in cell wall biosynthesis
MNPYKIAYITETSIDDKHAWSGTAHYVYKALQKYGHTVIALGPKQPKFTGFICKIINQLSLKIFNKRFDYRHSKIYSKAFGRLFTNELKNIDYDIIVVCGGTEYGAYLKTIKPIYYILDRTIEGALNYHTILTNLLAFSQKQSIETDKKAMLESRKVFFSSLWAANHAQSLYKLNESKIGILPFGANLDKIPTALDVLIAKDLTTVKLLLIGTYWNNKGADIAVNALNHLLKNNIKATLTVVGCLPPNVIINDALTIIPFVDKNSKEGIKQLWELYLSHHFFILPTRFDCTPIVFCEASAFGLPILTANTGGVAGHLKEGVNGFIIDYEDKGIAYAKKIISVISSPEGYNKLCASTRQCYDEILNWDTWSNTFTQEVERSIS